VRGGTEDGEGVAAPRFLRAVEEATVRYSAKVEDLLLEAEVHAARTLMSALEAEMPAKSGKRIIMVPTGRLGARRPTASSIAGASAGGRSSGSRMPISTSTPPRCGTRSPAGTITSPASGGPSGRLVTYRRAWATARKHLPLPDVAVAGGWKGTEALQRCYLDEQTMLKVVLSGAQLREVKKA